MAPNNTDDSFYLNYKDGFFISLFGIMIGLYLTAMTHRSLRNPCNYLLAFTAIGDLLHQLSYHVTLYYTVIALTSLTFYPVFMLSRML
uniref:Uncharacterized protein n=1 Tax=Ditylenchus dipsaci TaxID=166011 RepID=A0A915CZ12_9BILA